MSSLNLYDTTIPPLVHGLKALSAILKKAEEHASTNSVPLSDFIEGRLAPDMKPLPFQIQTCSNTAKFIAVRVAGHENQPMDDNEQTFEELHDRIAKTIEYLNGVKREEFDGKEGAEVMFRDFKFTGLTYLTVYAIPNFYFHMTTAYAILRNKGVNVGKLDFLGALPKQE